MRFSPRNIPNRKDGPFAVVESIKKKGARQVTRFATQGKRPNKKEKHHSDPNRQGLHTIKLLARFSLRTVPVFPKRCLRPTNVSKHTGPSRQHPSKLPCRLAFLRHVRGNAIEGRGTEGKLYLERTRYKKPKAGRNAARMAWYWKSGGLERDRRVCTDKVLQCGLQETEADTQGQLPSRPRKVFRGAQTEPPKNHQNAVVE